MSEPTIVTTFHPLDAALGNDPMSSLTELRSSCPVAHLSRPPFPEVTLVTSYQAVSEVYQGRYEFTTRFAHALARNPAPSYNSSLLTLDGDAHRRIRRVLVTALSPHLVDAAASYIADLAATVVAEIPDTGRADLRQVWAVRIPGKAVAHLIGVPETDHEKFLAWTMAKMATLAQMSVGAATIDELRVVEAPFNEYMRVLLFDRRSNPRGNHDILSELLVLRDDEGESLTDDEMIANAVFLLNAGNQTTQNLLMNLVHQLLACDLWNTVRADRSLVPIAVEESLRLTPPIQYAVRRPVTDTQVGGCPVESGEVLVLSHMAANRDPEAWGDDADEFRLDRKSDTKHLGFAMGPHSCLGSAVARRTAVIAINALMDRFDSLRLAPDFTWTRQDYWTSWGMRSLDVEWET